MGTALVVYALIGYPLIGLGGSHPYPRTPLFGVTPCPTTIFTLGMLMLTTTGPSWRVLAIPLLWSMIGGSAAVLLNVPQDYGLILAGISALAVKLFDQHVPRHKP